ncbi:MAG: hypothetical protein FGM33_08960 [Candidatus Kapabacteria bacterium]|nr:hypothetical protein [Candidatus Kapabacteria bacterium]
MRIMTPTRFLRVVSILAVLALVPQFAFAQLPVESQQFKLQGANSGSLILKTAATTSPYSLTYPNAVGSVGSFMYLASTDGTLAWSSAAGGDNYTPIWDADLNGTGGIVWVDPASANNPNWSLTGNALSGAGKLGTTTAQAINVVTENKTRITIAANGAVGINSISTSAGSATTIGYGVGHTTTVDGALDVNGNTDVDGTVNVNTAASNASATNINTVGTGLVTVGNTGNELEVNAATFDVNSATVTIDGTSTITGTTNINTTGTAITSLGNTGGGTSITGELRMASNAGTTGQVLVSKGTSATPAWESVGSAIGIRAAGRKETGGSLVSPTAATSVTVTGITLQTNDAIIVTIDGGNSNIVANVATRTNSTTATATDGSFVVQLSASYAGALNYLVIRGQ